MKSGVLVCPSDDDLCTHFISSQTARRPPTRIEARGGSAGAAIECGKSRSEITIIGLSRLVTRASN